MPKTQLMGILNLTPDSFFSDSRAPTVELAIAKALQMEKDGADILDIGGESTRPGSPPTSDTEELARVIPVLELLKGKLSIPISIDTRKPSVARAAITAGASLINDVTGFSDPEMIAIAKEHNVDICVMHMLGTPQTMQQNPHYDGGVVPFLLEWFEERVNILTRAGIPAKNIIIDPGIGFGKTVADNLEIIHNLPFFRKLGFRVLLGASRKSFLAKILDMPTESLLSATIAVNTLAIADEVDIIRVHDVKEHRSVIDYLAAYTKHIDQHNTKRLLVR